MNAFEVPADFPSQVHELLGTDRAGGDAPGEPIRIATLASPLGPLVAGATPASVCLLEFADPVRLEGQLDTLSRVYGVRLCEGDGPVLQQLREEMAAYFARRLPRFTVPLDHPGTRFQERVWRTLQEIPCGETWSYERMAARIGQPTAVRAVGAANGRNRLAILVPCHRLVGSNGKLVGYGGGLERKRWLLEHERAMVSEAAVESAV